MIEFLNFAFKNVSYYNMQPEVYNSISDINQLRFLPIITKNIVRANLDSFYYKSDVFKWAHTSGTTGSALIFPLSKKCFQQEYAFRSLHYLWGGIGLDNHSKIAMCSGHPVATSDSNKPPFWVYDYANNFLYFSSYHLSDNNLKYYIEELEKFQPEMLHGYPSSVYLLALAYKKYGKGILNLKCIYTSSETLFDKNRKVIEDAFQSKVFNWYGTSEMNANIVECAKGELHLKYEHSFVEILNNNNEPCLNGETGRMVSTNFSNNAFPLVRYDIGDIVTIAENQQSKCGCGGLLIKHIEGRNEDFIFTPDGRIVGRLDHLFKDSKNVIEAQIYQDKRSEVILKIVKNSEYSLNDEVLIRNEATTRLGTSIRIVFQYCKAISRTSNGKFKFIDSQIAQENILK